MEDFPDFPYDTALPFAWVREVREVTGNPMNPSGHIVWGYPWGSIFGRPVAVTPPGKVLLNQFNDLVYGEIVGERD